MKTKRTEGRELQRQTCEHNIGNRYSTCISRGAHTNRNMHTDTPTVLRMHALPVNRSVRSNTATRRCTSTCCTTVTAGWASTSSSNKNVCSCTSNTSIQTHTSGITSTTATLPAMRGHMRMCTDTHTHARAGFSNLKFTQFNGEARKHGSRRQSRGCVRVNDLSTIDDKAYP